MSLHEIFAFLDPVQLITSFGLIGVILIVFAESGVPIGFFLPGDSLLFSAGLLASQELLPLYPLLIGVFIAAVAGDTFGYWFGKKTGLALFNREDSWFFKKKYIYETQAFYEQHGRMTIILARFMPIVRTFAPIVAGVANMEYKKFLKYNVIGGFLWSFGMIIGGFFLGTLIPDVDKYLLPIILVIIFISFIPPVVHILRRRKIKNIVQ